MGWCQPFGADAAIWPLWLLVAPLTVLGPAIWLRWAARGAVAGSLIVLLAQVHEHNFRSPIMPTIASPPAGHGGVLQHRGCGPRSERLGADLSFARRTLVFGRREHSVRQQGFHAPR